MSSVLGSETELRPRRRLHFNLAHVLLLLPMLGFLGFFWYVTHHVTRPEIPLFEAAESGDLKAVRDHLATGTPIDSISGGGHTALFLAIQHHQTKVANYLLDNGASVDIENRAVFSPLYIAAGQGDPGLCERLIKGGADVNGASKNGVTALNAAADSGNPQVVKLLLDHGANANGNGEDVKGPPICSAAEKGNLESIKLLVQHGADINAKGFLGRAPLHLATARSHYDVVEYLIGLGANADKADAQGTIPLASALVHDEDPRLFWLLFRHTTNFKASDFHEGNLLHYAVSSNVKLDMLKALIGKGLDVNSTNYLGQTPLMIAMAADNEPTARLLEASGARMPLRTLIQLALASPKQPVRGGFMSVE